MNLTVISPDKMPATLPELAKYDAVILMNVPSAALPAGAMEALPVFVRELGKGLLMTGGDTSFGAGGYLRTPLETALPVYMDVKSRELASQPGAGASRWINLAAWGAVTAITPT